MGSNGGSWGRGPAVMAPLAVEGGGARGLDGTTAGAERWGHFDSSVNAVSFGFVATAILIAMFLVMAVFERFLRPRAATPLHLSPPGRAWPRSPWRRRPGGRGNDLEVGEPPLSNHQYQQQGSFARKLDCSSPKFKNIYHFDSSESPLKSPSYIWPSNDP
ncbi:hypothetical protein Taro_012574 [Colocasia esculenta]|uniref:Uncharacterized protein n=1 Tax=Colocasia esculenta TaxID=4460 RepID=A0A843UDU5_COLES|nr:hypothetical protein [Colocasia esculenta]